MESLTRHPSNKGYTNGRTMQRNGYYGRRHSRTSPNGSNGVNGRYNGDSGGGSDYDSGRNYWPPREWRSFTEIKFKISNVHSKAEVTELREYFESYGNVYKVQIETRDYENGERPTGVVYVTFKFV
jgi:hypothetical protein